MGSNSFLSKLVTYDPLNHITGGKFNQIATTATKFVDPIGGTLLGKLGGYTKSSGPGAPGPYGGVTPTLADANRGYVLASQGNNAQPGAVGASAPPASNASSLNNLFGPSMRQAQPVQQQKQQPTGLGTTWSGST